MIPITTPAMVTPATPAPFWERRTVIIEDGCARQTDFPHRDPLDRALDDDALLYRAPDDHVSDHGTLNDDAPLHRAPDDNASDHWTPDDNASYHWTLDNDPLSYWRGICLFSVAASVR